jgi:hypothetical protein
MPHAARCTQHRTALGRGSPPALVGSASNLQCGGCWALVFLESWGVFYLLASCRIGCLLVDTRYGGHLDGWRRRILFSRPRGIRLVSFPIASIDPSHRPPALPHCERKDQRKKEVEPRNPRIEDRGSRIHVHGAIQTSQLLANSPRSL